VMKAKIKQFFNTFEAVSAKVTILQSKKYDTISYAPRFLLGKCDFLLM